MMPRKKNSRERVSLSNSCFAFFVFVVVAVAVPVLETSNSQLTLWNTVSTADIPIVRLNPVR